MTIFSVTESSGQESPDYCAAPAFKLTALYVMTARLRATSANRLYQFVYKAVRIPRTCLLVTAVKTQAMAQYGCCTGSCIVLHLLIVLNLWRQVVAARNDTCIIMIAQLNVTDSSPSGYGVVMYTYVIIVQIRPRPVQEGRRWRRGVT